MNKKIDIFEKNYSLVLLLLCTLLLQSSLLIFLLRHLAIDSFSIC